VRSKPHWICNEEVEEAVKSFPRWSSEGLEAKRTQWREERKWTERS